MCGIAGFYHAKEHYQSNAPKWSKVLTEMRQCLSHRGDDGSGLYLSDSVGFSHARLNVHGSAAGKQPFVQKRDGHDYAVIYDGELYNTEELKQELQADGFSLKTVSNAELILYAYIHYGHKLPEKLNGVFALAVWDGAKKELFLARDRVGIKPFFYSFENGQLIFASEPKALFCFPGFVPEISMDSMREILAVGPARTMGNGVFCHVNEVLPGHFMVFTQDGVKDTVYWDLFRTRHTDTYEQTVEKTRFLVEDAVKRQMVSDVPVCTFLSGGIDSSIVTAIACRHMEQQNETLHTFSFDFKDNDIYFQSNAFQPERDLPYIKIMLDCYHTRHTYLECDEKHLFSALFDAVDAKDMPGMTDVDSSLLYFCSLVTQHNKVALTGECADEIFGGYPWFYRTELLNRDGFPWAADVSSRTLFLKDCFIKDTDLASYAGERYLSSMAKAPHLPDETPEEKRRYDVAYLNIKWFMQTLLDRMDRTGMYSGLEARVPFADHRIIEYVYNVPWEMKYQNGMEKALLRDACKNFLPDALLRRKKSPYPKTYHPGYEKLLIQEMNEILNRPNSPILSFVDKKKLQTFMQSPKEYGKPWFGQLMAGPQLLAYFIQINYWMEKYHLSVP